MRRCEDEKMRYRPPLLEEPCAQTLSGKTITKNHHKLSNDSKRAMQRSWPGGLRFNSFWHDVLRKSHTHETQTWYLESGRGKFKIQIHHKSKSKAEFLVKEDIGRHSKTF